MSKPQLSVGDPVPDFHCPASNTDKFHFSSAAGRYVVLCFFGSSAQSINAQALTFITGDLRKFFDDSRISFFGVSIDQADQSQNRVQQMIPGIRYFWDFDQTISTLYGAIEEKDSGIDGKGYYTPFTLVLDPNLRVLGNIPLSEPAHNQVLAALLASLPSVDGYAQVPITAPILIIPRVFEPALCRQLIDLYNNGNSQESGSMMEKDGYTVGRIDHNFKRRKDCIIEDEDVKSTIRNRFVRRIAPEIKKAFQFSITHIERYIVACYDGEDKGFFRAHRDNTTKGTAHRRFACTINLNAEDYEGGDLRFPEFGTRTYRAPTGGAVIFSCSLLHEATPVTQGKRYATLPFFYDAAAAKIREQNRQFLAGDIEALKSESGVAEKGN